VVPGEDGTVAHAQLSFGPGVIILGTARDDELRMKSPRDLGAVNQGIYVYLDDVDTHCARAKGAGAEIVRICLALPEATENPFGGHSPDLARARQDLRYDHRHRRGRR
jgi:uncharacterized glyoxalase superfamily protein PhnB